MKKYLFAVCSAVLAGCGHNDAADNRVIQLPAGGQTAVTINGTAVPQSLLEAIARQRNLQLDQPAQRAQALRMLTDLVLIGQEAQRENYATNPQFLADIEAARLKGVADATIAEFEKRTAISDAVLRAEYDAQVAHTGKSAYDFTQLLFETEDEALKAEGDVLAGKPFQQVYDAWKPKAKQARAFTRVRLDQVPDELAKIIASMQNGETTKVPVKTQFGWHVLHLDIVNPYSPPDFDQVKEGIRRNMQMKINRERMDKLKETAKIEYPSGVTPPPPSSAPSIPLTPTAAGMRPGTGQPPKPSQPATPPPTGSDLQTRPSPPTPAAPTPEKKG
jgi:hypothetical protein